MPKNHKKKYWFQAKRYGWGWGLPLTWQGWIVFIIYISLIIISSIFLPKQKLYILLISIFTIIFIIICWIKGEPPYWRWGRR